MNRSTWLWIGGGIIVLLGYVYYKNKQNASAASSFPTAPIASGQSYPPSTTPEQYVDPYASYDASQTSPNDVFPSGGSAPGSPAAAPTDSPTDTTTPGTTGGLSLGVGGNTINTFTPVPAGISSPSWSPGGQTLKLYPGGRPTSSPVPFTPQIAYKP